MEIKALVCITPQSNSKRLIDKGSAVVSLNGGGELLILHVQKGGNIFATDEASGLLQELFEYGKLKGGSVYAVSDDNIIEAIKTFIRENKVTDVILGEPPPGVLLKFSINKELALGMPQVHVHILEREQTND